MQKLKSGNPKIKHSTKKKEGVSTTLNKTTPKILKNSFIGNVFDIVRILLL